MAPRRGIEAGSHARASEAWRGGSVRRTRARHGGPVHDGVEGERGEAVSMRRRGACSGTRMTDMDEEPDVDADEFGDNYGGRGQEAERTRDRRRLQWTRTSSATTMSGGSRTPSTCGGKIFSVKSHTAF